ncbi:MAG: hypothetical protein SGJ16_01785, partial [Nitrospirota bacterium]|nr:hypothetical protein [Nitrospirota bacterium]
VFVPCPLLSPVESLTPDPAWFIGGRSVARAPGVTAIPRSDEHIPIQLLVTIIAIFAIAVAGFFSYDIYKSAKITDSLVKIESLGDVPARLERRVEETEKDFAETLLRQEAEHRKRMEEIEQRNNEGERKYNKIMRNHKEGSPGAEQIIFALLNKAGIGHVFSDLAQQEKVLNIGEQALSWCTTSALMRQTA